MFDNPADFSAGFLAPIVPDRRVQLSDLKVAALDNPGGSAMDFHVRPRESHGVSLFRTRYIPFGRLVDDRRLSMVTPFPETAPLSMSVASPETTRRRTAVMGHLTMSEINALVDALESGFPPLYKAV